MRAEDRIGRRSLAKLLRLHPDSVTRLLSDGLAVAVIEWGGRGKEMVFDRALALRFWNASTCRAWSGRPCWYCRSTIEDCRNTGEHLKADRHGYGQCPECHWDQPTCGPCRGIDRVAALAGS